MKAFVLAAGLGKRLRPLTNDVPKPMICVLNKPVIMHTLENLKKYGFDDVYINLFYRPEKIIDYLNSQNLKMKIKFSEETTLLGTAGAIKNRENFFDDTFVVMSGDGLSDINLKKALDFHKKKKALATIVLKEIDKNFDYGIVLKNKNSKICAFYEKPSWKDVFANTTNTGIYIFEPEIFKYIPKDTFFDFGKDLFPLLLKNKKDIFAYTMKEYWTDIGNIEEYRRGVFDALDGKINVGNISNILQNVYISDKAHIAKSVKIYGPCFIDDDVKIEKNTIIKPYSVISKGVKIGKNCQIEKTIIWQNSKIQKNVTLSNSVVGQNVLIQKNINLYDSILMG